jgi:hypothetical protein
MNPTVLLRIASILALIQYSAHTFIFLSITPSHGQNFGYGLLVILSGFVQVILLWQLAELAKTDPFRISSIIALFTLANGAHAFLVWKYFFLTPMIFDLVIAMFLALAFMTARKKVV